MEEGTFVGWLKQPGQQVAAGEPLFELESEKALQEIESIDTGILYLPPDGPAPGTVLPVGALLGYLLAEGEPIPTVPVSGGDEPKTEAAPSGNGNGPTDSPPAGPAVRRLAASWESI